MDETNRPKDNESLPNEGPLGALAKKQGEPRPPGAATDELPHPADVKHTGPEDYARGTPEHDDDREL